MIIIQLLFLFKGYFMTLNLNFASFTPVLPCGTGEDLHILFPPLNICCFLPLPFILIAKALIPAPLANPLETLWMWAWPSSQRIYAIKYKSQISLPHRGAEFLPQHLRWLLLWLWQCYGENSVNAGSCSSTGRQKKEQGKEQNHSPRVQERQTLASLHLCSEESHGI